MVWGHEREATDTSSTHFVENKNCCVSHVDKSTTIFPQAILLRTKEIKSKYWNTKIEKTGIHFKTDVFAAVAVVVVDAKAPYFLRKRQLAFTD